MSSITAGRVKNLEALMPALRPVRGLDRDGRGGARAPQGQDRHRLCGAGLLCAVPKPCMNGWGRRFMNITPAGKVLPCHAAETIPNLHFDSVREKPLAEIWAQVLGLRGLPRHRLDAGALPELRPARDRLGRLPLPGDGPDRIGGGSRSRLRALALACEAAQHGGSGVACRRTRISVSPHHAARRSSTADAAKTSGTAEPVVG